MNSKFGKASVPGIDSFLVTSLVFIVGLLGVNLHALSFALLLPALFASSRRPRLFHLVAFVSFALVFVNIQGFDPCDILFPGLLAIGYAKGIVRTNTFFIQPWMAAAGLVFTGFFLLSNVVGTPVISQVVQVVINVAVFLFVVCYLVLRDSWINVLVGLTAGAIISACICGVAIFRGWIPPSQFFEFARDQRLMGTFGDPNVYCFFLAFLALWLLDEVLHPRLLRGRVIFRFSAGVLILLCILLTLSRSGWLNFAAGLFTYAIIELCKGSLRRSIRVVATITALTAAGVLTAWVTGYGPELRARLISFLVPSSEAEAERQSFYYTRRAIGVARDHPLGVGTGGTARLFPNDDGLFIGAHNSYIQILADNGVGAFLSLLAVLAGSGWILIRRFYQRRLTTGLGPTSQAMISISAGLAVGGMFQDMLLWKTTWVIAGVFAGEYFCLRHGGTARSPSPPARSVHRLI